VKRYTRESALVISLGLLVVPVLRTLGTDAPPDYSQIFEKRDAMIPMRDGIKLHTEIYVPKHAGEPLPFIFERTPYGLRDDDKGFTRRFGSYQEMIPEGFIFVFEDIRGRYRSEDQFVMFRDPRDKKDPHAIDESTDTYDTIDWLLKNVPNNNGKVGILGIFVPRMADLDGPA
jgi:uncharacterized protein